MSKKIITAESVTFGHPDKLADLIADTILDECLTLDAESRVACEVLLAHDKVIIAGEITTTANVDYIEIAKEVIESVGCSLDGIDFEIRVSEQSPDICQAVSRPNQGAGDQGIMYGYATDETLNFMPLPIELAHRLTDRLEHCFSHSLINGLEPDGKAQVSIEYDNGRLCGITSVVVSAQHKENTDLHKLREEISEKVISYCLKDYDLTQTEILVNPSGRFVVGGFKADTGLTGRKLMVDTYGGIAHHGGGAFSGKDASKVDRSAAYAARHIAKNIVAAKLATKCEVSLSYAIGHPHPTAIDIDTFGTGTVSDSQIKNAVEQIYDLTPNGIINKFELKLPVFAQTAIGGHFGKDYLLWEQTDTAKTLLQIIENYSRPSK